MEEISQEITEVMNSIEQMFRSCEKSFSGFEEQDVMKELGDKRLDFLLNTYSRVENIHDTTNKCKEVNQQLFRNIWKGDMFNSETRLRNYFTDSDTSIPILKPTRLYLDSTPRRSTRSCGKPLDLPHVQAKILEYKRKSKKK